jgi:hypothetical protein
MTVLSATSPRATLHRAVARGCAAARQAAPILFLTALTGCATPPPVKQAVISVDQGYAENLEMMSQYRALVVQTNERYVLWSRYVQSRGLLNIAVKWATTDPAANQAPERAARQIDFESKLLGPELVALVNRARLQGLPARPESGGSVFEANEKGTMTGVVEALPGLVNAVNRRVDERMAEQPANDLSGFDAYATNVSALRQINATIKTYLDVDVTIKPEDLNEITQAIRGLR